MRPDDEVRRGDTHAAGSRPGPAPLKVSLPTVVYGFMRRVLLILAPVVAVVSLLGVALLRHAPVVAEGHLLPFLGDYVVYRVRVAGIELYVDKSFGRGDIVTSAFLIGLAAYALWLAWTLHRRGVPTFQPLLIAAGGALFLAGDDLLSLHETVGHNLGFLTDVPGVDHPDDVIMGLYALMVTAFCWCHRHLAPAGSRARAAWLVAASLGATAVLLDMLPIESAGHVEEGLEAACALALFVGALATGQLLLSASRPAASSTVPVPRETTLGL
jgi:hypothetical protein